MTEKTVSSRRAFLKGGALVAAPVASAAAAAVIGVDAHEARAKRLQAEAEVRALHQDWLRKVNTGDRAEAARLDKSVTGLAADHAGAPDEIILAADGQSAKGRFHLVVETETERPLESTLAQMAAVQGEGMIRSREPRVLTAEYVKGEAGWAIRRLSSEPV